MYSNCMDNVGFQNWVAGESLVDVIDSIYVICTVWSHSTMVSLYAGQLVNIYPMYCIHLGLVSSLHSRS
jgi:hypothetical protein